MTMSKVIETAKAEVGYLEKASNKSLDSKTANAGNGNFTKYSRDLVKAIGAPYANGVAWCDMFVDWCFITAYGKEAAEKMLGGFSAYTPTSAMFFKNMNRFGHVPHVGDVIFFTNGVRICHTGIVVTVDNYTVTTVEGNTTTPRGEGVAFKTYNKAYIGIAGYGTPLYDHEIPRAIAKAVTVYGSMKQNSTVHTWAGKKFPEVSFSPITKGSRIGICSEVTSEYGVEWFYIKVGAKYGFVPVSRVEIEK